MKRNIVHILLCLLLVLSLCPTAMAAALDTTDLEINGNVIRIGVKNSDAVNAALSGLEKTAKIAVPYTGSTEVYVLKDDSVVVPHYWDEDKPGYILFEVPGAGKYVITAGTLPTLDEQLEAERENIIITEAQNTLGESHTVADGTTIQANGHLIKGSGESKTLTAEEELTILGLQGGTDVMLGEKDQITFDTDGKATITPEQDGEAGYGTVKLTTRDEDGKATTRNYFLVEGETIVIRPDGTIVSGNVFAPGKADAKTPAYQVVYDAHDNSHKLGAKGTITARCNGLYDYYTSITLTQQGSSTAKKLAEKVNGKDVLSVTGVKVSEGSTVLTLESSYLNGLPVGNHTLTFHYSDGGYAESTLRISKDKEKRKADETNPKTGDPVLLAAVAMTLSASTLTLAYAKRKKH